MSKFLAFFGWIAVIDFFGVTILSSLADIPTKYLVGGSVSLSLLALGIGAAVFFGLAAVAKCFGH